MRPVAPKADLRPFQIAAASASDCATLRLFGLKGLAISTMRFSMSSISASDLDHRAVEQHHRDAEQVVGGDTVLQAMRAAGVHGDVAGDRAGQLARRVGGIEEA